MKVYTLRIPCINKNKHFAAGDKLVMEKFYSLAVQIKTLNKHLH